MEKERMETLETYDGDFNEHDIFFGHLYLIHFTEPFKGYASTAFKLYRVSLVGYHQFKDLCGQPRVISRLETTHVDGKYNYYLIVTGQGEERVGVGKDGPLITLVKVYNLKEGLMGIYDRYEEFERALNSEELLQLERDSIIDKQQSFLDFYSRVKKREQEEDEGLHTSDLPF